MAFTKVFFYRRLHKTLGVVQELGCMGSLDKTNHAQDSGGHSTRTLQVPSSRGKGSQIKGI